MRSIKVDKLRVGLIGLGEIAQIMHLPFLHELPQFEIAAICDISPKLVDAMGEMYQVKSRYADYRDLIAQPDIDIVAILTLDHADIAEAAADAGKHLFIEKPLCFDPEEGRRVIEAAKRNNVVLMVGYMKRYDPGYEYGVERMKAQGEVPLIRVHDFAGNFAMHGEWYSLLRGDDVPKDLLDAGRAKVDAAMARALGASHAQFTSYFSLLLMLCSHDLTVLRGAFGAPQGVLYTDPYAPSEILSVLDYGKGRRCVFEAGIFIEHQWWNESITAYGKQEIVTITFPDPYAKYARTVVTVQGSENGIPYRKEVPASHDEAFRREWLHLYDCITKGQTPRTTGEDANSDVELAVEMIRAIKSSPHLDDNR